MRNPFAVKKPKAGFTARFYYVAGTVASLIIALVLVLAHGNADASASRPASLETVTVVKKVLPPATPVAKMNPAAIAPAAPVKAAPRIPAVQGLNIPPQIQTALWRAHTNSGISYSFLARVAFKESSFQPHAGAGKSGPLGLMQIYPDSTMPELIREHAGDAGFVELHKSVKTVNIAKKGQDPVYRVQPISPAARQQIKDACLNPFIAATLTGHHHRDNLEDIRSVIAHRPVNQTDLYMAHFLGPYGAKKFLAAYNNPTKRNQAAKDYVTPAQASSNKHVFYKKNEKGVFLKDKKGRLIPKTVGQVYADIAKTMTLEPVKVAANTVRPQQPPSL